MICGTNVLIIYLKQDKELNTVSILVRWIYDFTISHNAFRLTTKSIVQSLVTFDLKASFN